MKQPWLKQRKDGEFPLDRAVVEAASTVNQSYHTLRAHFISFLVPPNYIWRNGGRKTFEACANRIFAMAAKNCERKGYIVREYPEGNKRGLADEYWTAKLTDLGVEYKSARTLQEEVLRSYGHGYKSVQKGTDVPDTPPGRRPLVAPPAGSVVPPAVTKKYVRTVAPWQRKRLPGVFPTDRALIEIIGDGRRMQKTARAAFVAMLPIDYVQRKRRHRSLRAAANLIFAQTVHRCEQAGYIIRHYLNGSVPGSRNVQWEAELTQAALDFKAAVSLVDEIARCPKV